MLTEVISESVAAFGSILEELAEAPGCEPRQTLDALWSRQFDARRDLTLYEIQMLELIKSSLIDRLSGRPFSPPDLKVIG